VNHSPGRSRRRRTTALPPLAALRLACRILREAGLEDVARSSGGDSVYLRKPGSTLRLRVSNHARTDRRRGQYPDVVHSLVFRDPKSARQVREMAEAALAAYLNRLAAGEDMPAAARDPAGDGAAQ
jgi:hypothetical protein